MHNDSQQRLEAFKKAVLGDTKVIKDMGEKVEVEGGVLDFGRYLLCYERSQKKALTILAAKVFSSDMEDDNKLKVMKIIGDMISEISKPIQL